MGKNGQSTYGQRKRPGDEYRHSRDESPYLHRNQKTTNAGRHFGNKSKHDHREGSNVPHSKPPRSELFHQSRRHSYQTSVLNRRNYSNGGPDRVYGPPTSIPHRSKNIRDHRYDRAVRDLRRQGVVLEQQVRKMLDSLAWLESDPDEMEWENSNLTYFVAALPINRDETRQTEGNRSGAVVPSYTDAPSRGGEKMESQRR